jgi:hypothetical protein
VSCSSSAIGQGSPLAFERPVTPGALARPIPNIKSSNPGAIGCS